MFILNFKIDKLIKKYRLSKRQVALECNMRPSTLKMYVDNTIQRINVSDIDSLYNFFYEFDNRITLLDLMDIKNSKPIDLSEFDYLFED